MQSLQVSYNKQLHEIGQTRQKINTILDEIEKTTLTELEDKMTSLKASVNTNVGNCSKLQNELKQFSDTIMTLLIRVKKNSRLLQVRNLWKKIISLKLI
ncbi:hypothetical protein DPMN_184753 [Dreissena polymorpha]|uniref:Uncharacterized protein n=1 Tax=Dreissena polymorpha TaxID=45954 RepID=A0A9D4I6Q6_DREPO|nr:hypothetical protein DPMN_184753 [Dreissena polymorpha]